jgi:ketosteroid isomerase-like protein
MTADIEWLEAEGMPYGGRYQGPQAVAENVFGPITTDIEGSTVTPQEYVASGDSVVSIGRYTGTGKETGKQLDVPFAHAWKIEGDKISKFVQFVDTAKFLEVVPAEVATTT